MVRSAFKIFCGAPRRSRGWYRRSLSSPFTSRKCTQTTLGGQWNGSSGGLLMAASQMTTSRLATTFSSF